MYYENQKEKRKGQIIICIFMVIIILLLSVLILRIDTDKTSKTITSNYSADKLSTNIEENVDTSRTKMINQVIKSVVGISKLEKNGSSIFLGNSDAVLGLGSGIILTDNGYILTNQHVVGDKYSNCYVTLENGETYNGSVVWANNNLDLAIVKISANNLDYMNLGDSDSINLADEVYAIGNPIGIEFQRTVTKGIISGIDRTIKLEEENSSSYMEDLIQTDATINEGNSGGPLINTSGELIGVNTVKISDADGIGFAVPINIIKPILESFVNNGKFEEAYLGIYGYDKEVIPYLDSSLKIESGIYVAAIQTDGPLFNKELKVGDIITKIDDIELNKMNDLRKYIYTKKPGDTVKLVVQRQGKNMEIEVNLGTLY
jgi:S1-C subfamily serine protease